MRADCSGWIAKTPDGTTGSGWLHASGHMCDDAHMDTAIRNLDRGDEFPDVDETLTALDEDPFVAGDASDRP